MHARLSLVHLVSQQVMVEIWIVNFFEITQQASLRNRKAFEWTFSRKFLRLLKALKSLIQNHMRHIMYWRFNRHYCLCWDNFKFYLRFHLIWGNLTLIWHWSWVLHRHLRNVLLAAPSNHCSFSDSFLSNLPFFERAIINVSNIEATTNLIRLCFHSICSAHEFVVIFTRLPLRVEW